MIKKSLYTNEYPNWGQAPKALIEKQPQYPYYSLPFRGKSEYRENFKPEDQPSSRQSKTHVSKSVGKPSP
jgi:hypothetical protein